LSDQLNTVRDYLQELASSFSKIAKDATPETAP
jgi:hypothetical protein